jgi:hypothetical protein
MNVIDETQSKANRLRWLQDELIGLLDSQHGRDLVMDAVYDQLSVEREHCPHPAQEIRCWTAGDGTVCAMCVECGAGWER